MTTYDVTPMRASRGSVSSSKRDLAGRRGLAPVGARQRIAAPIMGGLVTSFGLELLVYPVLSAIWKWRFVMRLGTVVPAGDSSYKAPLSRRLTPHIGRARSPCPDVPQLARRA